MIGYCPQFDRQYPSLTVKQHLYLYGRIKGLCGAELKREVPFLQLFFSAAHDAKVSLQVGLAPLSNFKRILSSQWLNGSVSAVSKPC